MSGHTPGPWVVLPEEVHRDYVRIRGTRLGCRYKICNVHSVSYEGVHEREVMETRANARLIAAAPDLLATLERIARWHDEFPDTDSTWPSGNPVSYGSAFGSNGERDFMRTLAKEAIAKVTQP